MGRMLACFCRCGNRLANFLYEAMEDPDGGASSKRLITFLAFLLLATAFLANLFWGLSVEAGIFDAMVWVALTGLGVNVAEKMGTKK